MCGRSTPLRERMACACLPLTGLGGAAILAGAAVAAMFNVLEGVLIAGLGTGAAGAALVAWRLWRSEVRLVHRYEPGTPVAPLELEPVPWWERAQFSREHATAAGTRAARSLPPATARTLPPATPPGAGVPSQNHLPPQVGEPA